MDREGGRAKKEELFGGGSGRVAFDVNEKGREGAESETKEDSVRLGT